MLPASIARSGERALAVALLAAMAGIAARSAHAQSAEDPPAEVAPAADQPAEPAITEVPTVAAAVAVGAPSRSMLGYNLDFPGDWTNLPPFIDQMKNARALRGECSELDAECDPAAHLALDEHGWVRTLSYEDDPSLAYDSVSVVVTTSNARPDIGQTFVVDWQGSGRLDVFNGADVRRDASGQRLEFRLQPGNTLLIIRAIDALDHLRSIRIFRKDHEALLAAGELFDPDMLRYLAPFGTLRFMDWMQSNAPGQCSGGDQHGQRCYPVINESCGQGTCLMPGEWSERPRVDQPSLLASGQYLDNAAPERGTRVGGYALEVMVALANRTMKSAHFNMPVRYTDDYVRQFATYVRDTLHPGLRVNVEYSNEVWNWGFPQASYAHQLGQARWPDEPSAWVQFGADRTDNLCRIWKEVFAGQEQRLRCLISPQTGWRDLATTVLECPARQASDPELGPCYQHADAVNITGYFSGCLPEHEATIQSWIAEGEAEALTRAFEQIEHGGRIDGCTDSLDNTIASYAFFQRLAARRKLELYVYESGTHFEYSGAPEVRQFFVALSRDERMHDLYLRNFQAFRIAGGRTFNVWGWVAPNDAWSNSDSLLDLAHPKYRAILDYCASGGC
jgi:hypothetical protein